MPSDREPSTPEAPQDPREPLRRARQVVVKVGTNVLSRPTGELSLRRVYGIIEDLVDLHRRGVRLILVSSGAISMGMSRLGLQDRPEHLADKQACAAIGQIRLMATYQQAFDRFGIPTAQILLTEEDFSSRRRYLNLRNTMSRLVELGVLPVVNENDTVSTTEIEDARPPGAPAPVFGDNDHLSALVASKLDADALVILSDVDGLHDRPPGRGVEARRLAVVERLTPEIEALAGGGNARGRGGMSSKLQAVRIALQSGIPTVIANGCLESPVTRILSGEDIGTIFTPERRMSSRKRWIGFATSAVGRIRVNAGALAALTERGSSLLFAGVEAIESPFRRGDIVSLIGPDGDEFARGISNYDSTDATGLLGKRSAEIEALAGANFPELVTRDNIALRH